MSLQKNTFVFNTAAILKQDIEVNSVGLIKNCLKDNKYEIFFIGKGIDCIVNGSILKHIDPYSLDKESEVKICNVCHILKPMEEFQINQTDAQGRKTRRPSCNDCRKHIDGVALLRSEKNRMERQQPELLFTCPICKKTSIPGATANLVIDHDHDNGLARAWICDSCNTGLGRFKDDINVLKTAIKYLESFED